MAQHAFPAGTAAYPPPQAPNGWNPLSWAIGLAIYGGYEVAP